MVYINDILEKLEEEKAREKRKKIKEWVIMTFKDLRNLIKIAENSGLDLTKITISEVLKSLRG